MSTHSGATRARTMGASCLQNGGNSRRVIGLVVNQHKDLLGRVGMDENSEIFLHLPAGATLTNGGTVYTIQSVLGDGGFGITYLARDEKLQRRVAIKEYYPRDFAGRTATSSVVPASRSQVDLFNWGKARFLDEARTLARFDHPGIVGVLDFFEGNNTAYLVMQFIDGLPMSTLLKTQSLDEASARILLGQLISALRIVHGAGYLHRDVKPANIMIHRDTKQPILIDFGAARQSLGSQTQSVTAMASASFSPKEQYLDNAPQTAASEVYSICATVYRAMFQSGPPVSIGRDEDDSLVELDRAKNVSPAFAALLRKGLAYHQRNRYQSLDELEQALVSAEPAVSAPKPKKKPAPKTPPPLPNAVQPLAAPDPPRIAPAPPVTRPWGVAEWIAVGVIALTATVILAVFSSQIWTVSSPLIAAQDPAPVIQVTEPVPQPPSPAETLIASLGLDDRASFIMGLRDSLAIQRPLNQHAVDLMITCVSGGGYSCDLAGYEIRDKSWTVPGYDNAPTYLAERACALMNANGCTWLGVDFERGQHGRILDKRKAYDLYDAACLMGNDYGCANMANLIVGKAVVGKSYSDVEDKVVMACDKGIGHACTVAGVAYELGFSAAGTDLSRAAPFYEKACNLDEAWGCSNLGLFFEYGRGGKTISFPKAKELYAKACSLGHPDACDWAKTLGG